MGGECVSGVCEDVCAGVCGVYVCAGGVCGGGAVLGEVAVRVRGRVQQRSSD